MKLRNLLLAGAAAGLLGGCAAYPYDDYGYNTYPARTTYYSDYYGPRYYTGPGYYTAPGYYTGPSVGFGVTYVDRDDDWRARREEARHRHYSRGQ